MLDNTTKDYINEYLVSHRIVSFEQSRDDIKMNILIDSICKLYEKDIESNAYYTLYLNMLKYRNLDKYDDEFAITFTINKVFNQSLNRSVLLNMVKLLYQKY